jgi:hypothetical protein
MKKTLLFFLIACLALAVHAQQPMPVILISASGKVVYTSPDSKKTQKAITGAVLKREGEIKLSKNTSVTLYCDGKFVDKSGKGDLKLTDIFPIGNSTGKNNFDLTFGDYTLAAFLMAANTSDKRDGWGGIGDKSGTGDGWGGIGDKSGTGDGWGGIGDKSGTGDGWGGKGADVTAIQPFGRLLPEMVRFYWSKPAGNDAFRVEIRDKNNQLLLETTTKDTFWVIDLKNGVLKPGIKYDWTVMTDTIRSNTMTIEIGDQAARDKALLDVNKGELFKKSPPTIQTLMHAIALETNGWYEEASRKCQQAQNAEPKNVYVKLMHAAFWVRRGLKPKARGVYR